MPIRIWQPKKYAAGFATSGSKPINGDAAAMPYSKDTLAREVSRYSGWAQTYYADTGEFEIDIPAGQVVPADIKKGYVLEIDDENFIIENYEWELEGGGYSCLVSGRGFGGRLDREVPTFRQSAGAVTGTAAYMQDVLNYFFNGYTQTLPEACGWFRDTARKKSTGWVAWSVPATFDKAAAFNSGAGGKLELVSYGALLRYVAAFFDVGYRFDFEFNAATGLHTLQAVLYKPEDTGAVIKSTDRGVTEFKYGVESRDSVNAVFAAAKSRHQQSGSSATEPTYGITRMLYDNGDAANWAEVANNWSGRAVDFGDVPQENDTSYTAAQNWLAAQETDAFTNDAQSVKFTYDNSGLYKYGVHFGLGSLITVVDEFLNVAATFRIYGVKKTYEAGNVVKYEFELGDRRISQADKILKRFAELDRKNYSV